jgi:hypothetical protein
MVSKEVTGMGQYYAKESRAQHDEALTPQGRDHESPASSVARTRTPGDVPSNGYCGLCWHHPPPKTPDHLLFGPAAECDEIVQPLGHGANQTTTQGLVFRLFDSLRLRQGLLCCMFNHLA